MNRYITIANAEPFIKPSLFDSKVIVINDSIIVMFEHKEDSEVFTLEHSRYKDKPRQFKSLGYVHSLLLKMGFKTYVVQDLTEVKQMEMNV